MLPYGENRCLHGLAGRLIVQNETTAGGYDPKTGAYEILPSIDYVRDGDYQDLVRRVVRDRTFVLIGQETIDGKTVYDIEVKTGPSFIYTTYLTDRIRAWIDPETGLARNVSTYFDSDIPNHAVEYTLIEVNTDIPASRFVFVPPPGSHPRCAESTGHTPPPKETALGNMSPALVPGCLNCTNALLKSSIGGFSGNPMLIIQDWTTESFPSTGVNYTFYSGTADPGIVRFHVRPVAGLFETKSVAVPDGLTFRIEPEEIMAEPFGIYTARFTAQIDPDVYPHGIQTTWLSLHAEVEGTDDAIADDWVRMVVTDEPYPGLAGHFYTKGGSFCQGVLVLTPGESGSVNFFIHTGERDTGPVTLSLSTIPCNANYGPVPADACPDWPEEIQATIEPDSFTGRSFGNYLSEITFTTSPELAPGDYCFSANLRTPTGGLGTSQFVLRVVPG